MLYNYIVISYCLCVLFSIICMSIVSTGSTVFILSNFFDTAIYFLMAGLAFVASKVFKFSDTTTLVVSSLLSYIGLLLIFCGIQGKDIFSIAYEMHQGQQFVVLLLPFIASNIALILWSSIKGKK